MSLSQHTLQNPYARYQQVAVDTATPQKSVLMLMDGAIRFMKQAKQACVDKKIEAAHTNLVKVQAIYRELQSCLDLQFEIGQQLNAMYEFFIQQMIQANVKKDGALIDEVLPLSQDLRNTWAQIMNEPPKV